MTGTPEIGSPATRSTMKPRSLHVTTPASNGPKPLHLLHTSSDAPLPSPSLSGEYVSSPRVPPAIDTTNAGMPSTPLSANSNSFRPLRTGQGRRQSSISYISSPTSPASLNDKGTAAPEFTRAISSSASPLSSSSSRQPLARSMSLGGRGGGSYRYGPRREVVGGNGENRHSTGNILTVDASNGGQKSPPPPVTLADKHAELLHFIAQKESKCLELRQQLATHEAELLQLKRKWERIIARGFEKTTGDYNTLPTLRSIPSFNANNPDQVQALTSPPLNGGPTVLEGIREGVQGVTKFISANISDFSKTSPGPSSPVSPWKPLHAAHRSNASISMESDSTGTTRTTGSTTSRLSLSSISSLGESPVLEEDEEFSEFKRGVSGDVSSSAETDTTVSSTGSARPAKNLKSIRRRSRDASSLNGAGPSPLLSSDASTSTVDRTSYPLSPLSPMTNTEKERKAAKRASLSVGGLQSSFGSSGWADSLGKKWGEIREGSDSTNKNIKRASILISDVSQSFYSAWASPPTGPSSPQLNSMSSNQALSSSASSSTLSHATSKSHNGTGSGRKQRATLAPSPNASLLDDSDDDQQVTIPASVLTPDSPLTPKPVVPASSNKLGQGALTKKVDDDDDDWNW